jgi:hypothetical protein
MSDARLAVATLRLFTAAGRATRVPLHDNAYFALAGTGEYPLRLVAYDKRGLVIGTRSFKQERSFGPMPLPGAQSTLLVSNSAGQVWTTPGTNGTICYAFDTKVGGSLSCNPRAIPANSLMLATGGSPGTNAMYVTGRVGPQVSTVRVKESIRNRKVALNLWRWLNELILRGWWSSSSVAQPNVVSLYR